MKQVCVWLFVRKHYVLLRYVIKYISWHVINGENGLSVTYDIDNIGLLWFFSYY